MQQLLTPNVVSWNAAMSACEKGKQWGGALGLLQDMVHQLLAPDVVSLNAAISACCELKCSHQCISAQAQAYRLKLKHIGSSSSMIEVRL